VNHLATRAPKLPTPRNQRCLCAGEGERETERERERERESCARVRRDAHGERRAGVGYYRGRGPGSA
jgi:hypothetical protein